MKLLLLGAGMMARGAAYDLSRQPDVEKVIVADMELAKARELKKKVDPGDKIEPVTFSATDENRIRELMKGCSTVMGMTSYDHNYNYSRWAIESGCNFVDLGGNHDVVDKQFTLSSQAEKAKVGIIPDCGIAPGLVSILAGYAVTRLDEVEDIELRVGGLPVNPEPPLNYFLVFSSRGLVNEYIEDARILENGQVKKVAGMSGLETLYFKPPFGKMEAFYTSGGTSTLTQTLKGKIKNLTYKTIRYPSHQHYVKLMMDLGLMQSEPIEVDGCKIPPRRILEKQFEKHLKGDGKDVILLRATARGVKDGLKTTLVQEIIDYHNPDQGLTAMMRMTAFPASILTLMLARNQIKEKGVLHQELSVPFDDFIKELRKRKVDLVISKTQIIE
ncbi:MAG: saccharopine dehydrogenase C-terminal domain-containing protein [Vulcanimicrobiota bacterium]